MLKQHFIFTWLRALPFDNTPFNNLLLAFPLWWVTL